MKTLLFLLLFVVSVGAQQPDRWRGLVLDESTPEEAIKVLGSPKKDSINRLRLSGQVSKSLSKIHKEKIFRVLEFDLGSKEGVQKAALSFHENKLVLISLDLKSGEVSPNGLANIYGLPFYPMTDALSLAMSPKDFERNQGKIYPKTYPVVFNLVAVGDRSFVSALVSNVPSFLGALAKSAGVPDEPGRFPGKVETVDLISRTLENKDGSSILK